MFELEYCSNPEIGELHSSGIKFDYQYDVEFDSKLKTLDKFLFLVDMHTIIDSCAKDFLEITIDDFDEFWKINKRLLNFVNAVYGYKEYVNSYEPSLKSITEKYYNMKKWYRFLCDFRNYIIHQSIIIKDYRPSDGDVFINIGEVVSLLSEYDYPNDRYRRNAEEFTKWLECFKDDSLEIKDDIFLSMKNVTSLVVDEMSQMKNDVLLYAYRKSIQPSIEWLIKQIPIIDGKFQYVFVVDKHYTKVAGILYNGKDCRVFMNQEEVISPAAKLQRLEYYTQLFVPDTIDKGRIYELTKKINNCLHKEFGVKNLNHRMIFTACALVAVKEGAILHKGTEYRI